MKDSILKEKSYNFALRIVKMYKYLAEEKKEFVFSKQVLRAGTSIGANIEEANQAQSKADFVHKLSIANKEAFETNYWLRLLRDSEILESRFADSCLKIARKYRKYLFHRLKRVKIVDRK